MPLQHIYLVTKRIYAIATYLFGYVREYMPLQHIYLVTKRIHAIATYLFGY